MDIKEIAAIAGGRADSTMTRDDALAKLRSVAFQAGVNVRRGRIYVPGKRSYFAGTGDASLAGLKSAWTEFAYGIAYGGTEVRDLKLVELLQKEADTDRSWIRHGQGAYLCTEHKLQFMSIAASHAHSDEAHPERRWSSHGRGAWVNPKFAAKIVDMSDMGGGVDLWIDGKLWDSGYKNFEHARDCFVDMVARGEAKRVAA